MIPQFYCRICALTTMAGCSVPNLYVYRGSEARKMHHKLSKRAEGALLHVARWSHRWYLCEFCSNQSPILRPAPFPLTRSWIWWLHTCEVYLYILQITSTIRQGHVSCWQRWPDYSSVRHIICAHWHSRLIRNAIRFEYQPYVLFRLVVLGRMLIPLTQFTVGDHMPRHRVAYDEP